MATRKTGRSSQSTARKKSSTARQSNNTRRSNTIDKNENGLWDEVILLLLMAFSILLLLSNFNLIGSFGQFVSGILFGIFGIMAYIAPLLLFLGACFVIANRGNMIAKVKIYATLVLFLELCIFSHMFVLDKFKSSGMTGFQFGKEKHMGGGALGGVLAGFMHNAIGTVGTYLILIVLIIICMVLITEKSFVKVVRNRGERVYQSAKEDAVRRKEIREIRMREWEEEKERRAREQEKLENEKRMNRKVAGVAINTEITRPKEEASNDIHEITQNNTNTVDEPSFYQTEAASSKTQSVAQNIELAEPKEQEMKEQIILSEPVEAKTESEAVANQEVKKETIPLTVERLNEEEFDFESIQIKMADSFAEEAKIEEAYELPKPEMIQEEMMLKEKSGNDAAVTNTEAFMENQIQMENQMKPQLASQTKSETDYIHRERMEARLPEDKMVHSSEKQQMKQDHDISQDLQRASVLKNNKPYRFPPISLLTKGQAKSADSRKELQETAMKLQQTLKSFGVNVTMTEISQGPTVTRYEMQPEQGVKVSKIVGLTDDIKLNLAASDIRIEAPIPGKAAIGIEVPNKDNSTVMFRELIENDKFQKFPSNIAFAVGKDISGDVVVTDIGKMPHLLIAGATGSGKSVCINTLIMSILYKANPEDVKLIMVDPKVVELSVYNGIPHLMVPVVTDPKKAAAALHWGVAEMTDRYKKFADFNVRDLKGYNKKVEEMTPVAGEEPLKKLPQIIIIVDELADLMMVSPGEVEESICRLAQLARAAGIHLVIATQRPSVDVITGLIKANMPSRIAFSVSSGVDSRTILDMNGAEKLLGKGDMLFYPQGYSKPARVQGAFVSDKEVQDIVDFLKSESEGPSYSAEVEQQIATAQSSSGTGSAGSDGGNERDVYFVDAAKFIIDKDKASIGMLQRVFKIGFNRAARIMDQLAEAGVVGEEEGTKPRKVLMSEEQFEQYVEEYL